MHACLNKLPFTLLLSLLLMAGWLLAPNSSVKAEAWQQTDEPVIHTITTNAADYLDEKIPQFAKFELTFTVDTIATNLQWPYDASPPTGVQPGIGVTVNALFTPDQWQTVYIQPAFYFQNFLDEERSGQAWIYPTGDGAWKVRFTPTQPGEWQYKVSMTDAGGAYETKSFSFTVAPSGSHGFVRVSQRDSRYFEFEDGAYFPALGFNLALPAEQASLPTLAENGIQLIRTWLPSQLSIFGAAWSPWRSYNPLHNGAVPDPRLRYAGVWPFNEQAGATPPLALPQSEVFLWLSHNETVYADGNQWDFSPCMLLGWQSPPVPVQRNTNYRVRVRYREHNLTGPKVADQPYGFTVKLGDWLWSDNEAERCYAPGVGEVVAATYSTTERWSHGDDPDNPGWQMLEGRFNSGEQDFLHRFHLAIENATAGDVLVDRVWVEAELGSGQFGPNVIDKPWMAQHQYFAQRSSYQFDRVLAAAEEEGIYLKIVILDKQDYLLNIFQPDGKLAQKQPHELDWKLFWGNGREEDGKTKVRWLQETWWRYLQARWGYSPNIHSWELINEGDPEDPLHYLLADEMGKYFSTRFIPPDQIAAHPNRHLATTSFWTGFPQQFWANADYANIDYADIHHYAQEDTVQALTDVYTTADFYDSALFSQKLGQAYGARQANGAGKPLMRGETGFIFSAEDRFAQNAANGLWLHNLIWAGIDAGGLIESYWTGWPTQEHIVKTGSHDHRPIFKTFYNFIRDIPLSNGDYTDAQATASAPDVRVWGQKDLRHGLAHLWIQNRHNTWKNVADSVAIAPISTVITVPGFEPNERYRVEWWDTYLADAANQIMQRGEIVAQADGTLQLSVENLTADIAVKLFDQNPTAVIETPLTGPAVAKLSDPSGGMSRPLLLGLTVVVILLTLGFLAFRRIRGRA